ncbi:MAG: cation-transporting P-type ATPase, partial [Nitriliruptoraceae bacterium]
MNVTLHRRRTVASPPAAPIGQAPADLATLTPDEVSLRLGSRPSGLTAAEAAARLTEVGPNELEEAGGTTLLQGFVANV